MSKCNCCGRELNHLDKVTIIIPDVEVQYKRKFHLKLSKNGIDVRTIRMYCAKCLKLNEFLQ